MTVRVVSVLTAVFLAGALVAQSAALFKGRRPIIRSIHKVLGIADTQSTQVSVDIRDFIIKGSPAAAVVLMAFVDYACPECTASAEMVEHDIQTEFIDTGKVFYVVFQKPAPGQAQSWFLARAAVCGGNQGRFWNLHDRLLNVGQQSILAVLSARDGVNLDMDAFRDCMERGLEAGRQIAKDIEMAWRLKIESAPAYAIGLAEPDGRVTVEARLAGRLSASALRIGLETLIQRNRQQLEAPLGR